MKKEKFWIVSLIIVIVSVLGIGINQLKGKDIPTNMKNYIGEAYEVLPRELKSKGIEIILGDNSQVIELVINRKGYKVDSIQIGDSIEKVYRVYPKEWIHIKKNTIQIIYGKESHYGVATDFIIYTIGKNEEIQGIRVGKTAPFVQQVLPESNQMAKDLIEGEWISSLNHKLTFSSRRIEDNYLDSLWDKQYYMIIAPNTLMISRYKVNEVDKVKLYFWIVEDILYLFTIDEQGMPIQGSIEMFFRT